MATEFRSESNLGTGFGKSVTWSMVADEADLTLYAPVILTGGSATAMPKVDVVASAGSKLVIGVVVALPADGTITADSSPVSVCVQGRCKVKVGSAAVSLNDPLQTSGTDGEAEVQADPTVDPTDAASVAADVAVVGNNVRKAFAIALSTSANADSIVLCYVNINTCRGDITVSA